MIKEVELFVVLVALLIAIMLIFNARLVVRRKMDVSNENTKVIIVKIVGVILAIISLGASYYLLK